VTSLLNNEEFLTRLKNQEFNKMKKTEEELRAGALTPDFTDSKQLIFDSLTKIDKPKNEVNKTKDILSDLKALVRQVTTKENPVWGRYFLFKYVYWFIDPIRKFSPKSWFRQLTRKTPLYKGLTKKNTINPFLSQNTMSSRISKNNDKRATNEVISQLVNMQREMKREKRKDNYDSDESEDEVLEGKN
jgi:hypothetical protein